MIVRKKLEVENAGEKSMVDVQENCKKIVVVNVEREVVGVFQDLETYKKFEDQENVTVKEELSSFTGVPEKFQREEA